MATPNTYLNLNAAAKHSGWNKSTLSKAIKSGRLPVKEKKGNQYFIDPIDLEREFPQKKPDFVEATNKSNEIKQMETAETTLKIRELELELKHSNEKLSDAKEQLEKKEAEYEKLLDTVASQTKLLTYQQETIHNATQKPPEARKGLWATLLGK